MEWFVVIYFAIGFVCSLMWWNDEYKADYELARKNGSVETSMASLLLLMMTVFWPLKAIMNCIEGLK